MNNIEEKLDILIKMVERIERRLNIIEESCTGMDSHINFVNGVYGTVKSPLNFILNRVSFGSQSRLELPDID